MKVSICIVVFLALQVYTVRTTTLELVASFEHQATGVSIHKPSGRIFVNFPRWSEDAPVSVAEVISSTEVVPFPPNSDWNAWRNTRKDELDPTKYFICVQSVFVFEDSLFVLDPAAPGMGPLVPRGPKLVEIDLIQNVTKRTILFGEDVVPQGSYMNDVRVSPDGKYAYITDSGIVGALIFVDLKTGQAKRVLSGHPSTQADHTVVVKHLGKPIIGSNGHGVEASADGIDLSVDGSELYWQAIRGKTLYSIPTSLIQYNLSDAMISPFIQTIGINGPADGFWISRRQPHLLYVSSIEDDSVKVRNLLTNSYEVKLTDPRLRWPDTFSEDAQGYIYVTSSHIQDSAVFDPNGPIPLPTELWRFRAN